jgi:hypothetical protein
LHVCRLRTSDRIFFIPVNLRRVLAPLTDSEYALVANALIERVATSESARPRRADSQKHRAARRQGQRPAGPLAGPISGPVISDRRTPKPAMWAVHLLSGANVPDNSAPLPYDFSYR